MSANDQFVSAQRLLIQMMAISWLRLFALGIESISSIGSEA
jgi:hypothetical protein